jgi:hypothetical protein
VGDIFIPYLLLLFPASKWRAVENNEKVSKITSRIRERRLIALLTRFVPFYGAEID